MFASLTLVALSLLPQAAAESPLLGKPCPALDLSRAVQGAPVHAAELVGRIALYEFFELGNAVSFDHALPTAQKLATQYAKDPRVAVIGVATAFPPAEKAAALVDADVRTALAAKRIYVPVMRDRTGSAVQAVALGGAVGVPRTLLIDAEGIVRWHGSNTTAESAAAIEQEVARLLAAFWVEPIANLPVELESYSRGDLPKAGSTARRINNDAKADPALKAVAAQVEKNLEAGAKKLLDAGRALRAEGFPARAQEKLENAVKIFAVVPSAIEAGRLLQQWKEDKVFRRELAGEALMVNALELLGSPKDLRRQVRERLEKYVVTYADTAIAPRVQKALASLD